MAIWKIWLDLRQRVLVLFLFVLFLACAHIAIFPFLKGLKSEWMADIPELNSITAQRVVEDYRYYADYRWYQEIEVFSLIAVFLSLGGVTSERRSGTVLLTLSYPVQRRDWLLVHSSVALAMLCLLSVFACMLFYVGGFLLGQPIPLLHSLWASLLLMIAAAVWISLTMLISTFVASRIITVILAIAFMVLANNFAYFPSANRWLAESLGNVAFSLDAISNLLRPTITMIAVSILALAIALYKFEQTNF